MNAYLIFHIKHSAKIIEIVENLTYLQLNID